VTGAGGGRAHPNAVIPTIKTSPAARAVTLADNFVAIEPSTRQTQMTVSILVARELVPSPESALEYGIISYQRFFQASLNGHDCKGPNTIAGKGTR
jgi:hypothetical protein